MGVAFLAKNILEQYLLAPKSIGIFSQLRSFKKKLALGPLIKFKILREKHTHTHTHTNDKTNGGWKSTKNIMTRKLIIGHEKFTGHDQLAMGKRRADKSFVIDLLYLNLKTCKNL